MTFGEIILYTVEDGSISVQLRAKEGTVWLTQAEIATLFQTSPQNITLHIKSIYAEKELMPQSTCKELLQVRLEGDREIHRNLKYYNLNMILSIGYRIRSPRGIQFRQWATTHLQEYLVKGFVMDDARLKEPTPWDYFDEWLERIREIRASEKRFYQKVRDIYARQSIMIARVTRLSFFSRKCKIKCSGLQRIIQLQKSLLNAQPQISRIWDLKVGKGLVFDNRM